MFRPFHPVGARRDRTRAGLTWALALLCLCVLTLRPASAAPADRLDINATIHVTVAGEPDVSGDYLVDSQGNITMLYVNEVHVGGLTIEQTRKEITKELSKFIKNPQVLVRLVSPGGIIVDIHGAVITQGERVVRSDTRLDDFLQAAGTTLDADLTQIKIVHGRPNQAHTTDTINYLAYLNDKDAAGNPLLHDSDVISVPKKNIPIQINVRGQVIHPGRSDVAGTTTVYDALQAAGGLTESADRKNIYVEHANSTDKVPFDYQAASEKPGNTDVNPILIDGDTIIIDALPAPSVYTITGGVVRPSEYPLTMRTSLADALGKAGGAQEYAHLNETQIIRTDQVTGKAQVLKIKAQDPNVQASTFIQPGDNISIPPGQPKQKIDALTLLSIAVSIATLISVFRRR